MFVVTDSSLSLKDAVSFFSSLGSGLMDSRHSLIKHHFVVKACLRKSKYVVLLNFAWSEKGEEAITLMISLLWIRTWIRLPQHLIKKY